MGRPYNKNGRRKDTKKGTEREIPLHKVKGKAFPPQAWTGPWGSRRLRLQNF
jgi:hypothetical protein